MLNVLVENFEQNFLNAADNEVVERCLKKEREALSDIAHLEAEVIGEAPFEWDYNVLQEGFMDLAAPFMQEKSGAALLFLRALREFGVEKPDYLKGLLILEYSYFSILINDYYAYHELFTEADPDIAECGKLTQLRYVSQYITQYPRYLLVRNKLNVGQEVLFKLNRLVSNMAVTANMARGRFLHWSRACFAGVALPDYLQNSIDICCIYLLFPVLFAANLANVPDETMHALKKALSYLTLFAKLRCERRALAEPLETAIAPYARSTLLPMLLPGFLLLRNGLGVNPGLFTDRKYPDMRRLAEEITCRVRPLLTKQLSSQIKQEEEEYFERFLTGMDAAGVCEGLTSTFRACYNL